MTTQGYGGPPRMSDQPNAGATSETAQTRKTIHTKHTLNHPNKANMERWLRRPNDIRGPWGPKVSWHLTGEEKPRKNLTQETCHDRGTNPGPLRDKRACYHLLHSGGPFVLQLRKISGENLNQGNWIDLGSNTGPLGYCPSTTVMVSLHSCLWKVTCNWSEYQETKNFWNFSLRFLPFYVLSCNIKIKIKIHGATAPKSQNRLKWLMLVQGILGLAKRYPSTLISVFLTGFRYFSYQVATQLASRRWVDPVPDPILLENFLGYNWESNPGPLGWVNRANHYTKQTVNTNNNLHETTSSSVLL